MDDMTIVTKLQKSLGERLQQIGDSILAGGVDNMEKYRYAVGQAHAIQLTLQEISNLLKPKEQKMSKETLSTSETEKTEAPKIKLALQENTKKKKKLEI